MNDENGIGEHARRMVADYFKWLASPEGRAAREASERRLKETSALLDKGKNIAWERLHDPFTI